MDKPHIQAQHDEMDAQWRAAIDSDPVEVQAPGVPQPGAVELTEHIRWEIIRARPKSVPDFTTTEASKLLRRMGLLPERVAA